MILLAAIVFVSNERAGTITATVEVGDGPWGIVVRP